MRPVKTHDVHGLDSVDQVLEKLEEVLSDLIEISDDVNSPEDVTILKNNIEFMKRYYERAERLLLDQQTKEKKEGASNDNLNTISASSPIEYQSQPEVIPAPVEVKESQQLVGAKVPKQRTKISWGTSGLNLKPAA